MITVKVVSKSSGKPIKDKKVPTPVGVKIGRGAMRDFRIRSRNDDSTHSVSNP
jgi:hypothetical protein